MEILKKAHYLISRPVTSYSEIKADAQELKKLIDRGKFKGYWQEAYAISHCQVSRQPYCFFVVAKNQVRTGLFKHRVYVNLKIIEAPLHEKHIGIAGQPPVTEPNAAEWDEACMSFPYRDPKRVLRYNRIKVTYQVPVLGLFMRTITEWAEGLRSQVYQHEYDHSQGENIFYKTETPQKWWNDNEQK